MAHVSGNRRDRDAQLRTLFQGLAAIAVSYVCLALLLSFFLKNGVLVPLDSVSGATLVLRMCCDLALVAVPIVCLIPLMLKNRIGLSGIGFRAARGRLVIGVQLALAALYLVLFIVKGDYTQGGIYAALYYLLAVALVEEAVFRGFLFHWFNRSFSQNTSIVLSGLLFGLMHSLLPIVLFGANPLVAVSSNLLGGVVGGALFSVVYLRTGNLLASILLHAVLDYSGFVWPFW